MQILLHWMHTFSPMHKWDTFSISCSGQKQKHHVFLFLMWGCFQDIRSLSFFHVCHIEMLQPSYLHHTVSPCCSTQTQVKIRNTTGSNPLLTCISGGGISKQKYGNFCFCCMYERGLCWHVLFSRHAHSNSTSLLQKSKSKSLLHWMHTFSPMHKWDTFSISCSGQKTETPCVSVFDMGGCFQDIRSLAVFHVCHIDMLQPSDLHHTISPCSFTQTQVKKGN